MLKTKLTSRKLWAAIAGIVAGLAMVFGLDADIITTVAGAVTALASVITYIITEGRIDAESVKNAVSKTQEAYEIITVADSPGATPQAPEPIATGANGQQSAPLPECGAPASSIPTE